MHLISVFVPVFKLNVNTCQDLMSILNPVIWFSINLFPTSSRMFSMHCFYTLHVTIQKKRLIYCWQYKIRVLSQYSELCSLRFIMKLLGHWMYAIIQIMTLNLFITYKTDHSLSNFQRVRWLARQTKWASLTGYLTFHLSMVVDKIINYLIPNVYLQGPGKFVP